MKVGREPLFGRDVDGRVNVRTKVGFFAERLVNSEADLAPATVDAIGDLLPTRLIEVGGLNGATFGRKALLTRPV